MKFTPGSRVRISREHPTFANKTGVVYFCSSRIRSVDVKKKQRHKRDTLVNLLFDEDDVLQPLRCIRKSSLCVGYNVGDCVRILDNHRRLTRDVGVVLSMLSFGVSSLSLSHTHSNTVQNDRSHQPPIHHLYVYD